jgi:hypothetical protein
MRNPGPLRTEIGGCALRAPLSRMQRVLVPIKPTARRQGQVQCTRATAERLHRRRHRKRTHERDQTIHGSVGCDDASGASPKGLEQAFAATLQISPSMWSQIKSSRPIGDKLARQIESACQQRAGWLDETRKDATPSAAEAAFVELALFAWRSTNSAGRKALREQLKDVAANSA